jgi:hypothetical protein
MALLRSKQAGKQSDHSRTGYGLLDQDETAGDLDAAVIQPTNDSKGRHAQPAYHIK